MSGYRRGGFKALPLILFLTAPAALYAHETITTKLTWTAEISRIFERRCIGCHRERGPAPMALTTYAAVRPWAVAIREEVLGRRMPPWDAVKGFGDFLEEGGLSQDEIQRIAAWVTGGAPEGEPQYLMPMKAPEVSPPGQSANSLSVRNASVLTRAITVRAIRPVAIPPGASVKVTAQTPDGIIEPLLWILNYQPKWNRTYVYREPIRLAAGTRIQVDPPEGGSFRLFVPAALGKRSAIHARD